MCSMFKSSTCTIEHWDSAFKKQNGLKIILTLEKTGLTGINVQFLTEMNTNSGKTLTTFIQFA